MSKFIKQKQEPVHKNRKVQTLIYMYITKYLMSYIIILYVCMCGFNTYSL